MKLINFLTVIFLLFTTCSCYSQKLIQKETDAQKVIENKDRFIGKPLKELLAQIKPPIMRVTATPSKNIQSYVGNFHFYFMGNEAVDKSRSEGKAPITIVVYVKENFDWDFQKRPKGKETVWTPEDAIKYGDLTIVGFRIYGDASTPN